MIYCEKKVLIELRSVSWNKYLKKFKYLWERLVKRILATDDVNHIVKLKGIT